MIGQGDKIKALKIQDELVHTLGNLTLSGYNSKLSTHLSIKNDRKNKDDVYVGYKWNVFK